MATHEGFHTVTPYLVSRDAEGLINFVQRAFGGVETHRVGMGPGMVHAEMRIGDSMIMVGGGPNASPTTAMLYLSSDDVDAAHNRAVQAGATSVQEPTNTPDGARRAGVRDAFGNQWYFGSS